MVVLLQKASPNQGKQISIVPVPLLPSTLSKGSATFTSRGYSIVVNSTTHPQTVVFRQFAIPPILSPTLIEFLERSIDRTHAAPQVPESNTPIHGPVPGSKTDLVPVAEKLVTKPIVHAVSMQSTAYPTNFRVFVNKTVMPPTRGTINWPILQKNITYLTIRLLLLAFVALHIYPLQLN